MTNIKIVVYTYGQAILSDNPADGILAKLYFEKLKKEEKFDGDYAQRLPFLEWSDEGFYHISRPLYKNIFIENQTVYKGFDAKEYVDHNDQTKPTKSLFSVASGKFKRSFETFEKSWIDEVVIYARGDFDVIKELLANLRYIGKKNAYGWGRVQKIVMEEMDEDFSVVKDGKLMRHIPIKSRFLEDVDEKNYAAALKPLFHPYWDRGRERYCAFPTK